MRRAARVDANHADLVRLMRMLGAHVADTHALGGGFPDVVVSLNGQSVYCEIKDGSRPPSERKLTDDEQMFAEDVRGRARYVVVETEWDAVALVNSLRGAE